MRFANDIVFDAVAVSSTTAYASDAIPAESMVWVSVQAVTSGSNPNGALKIQFSNDLPSSSAAPSNWSDVASATVSTTANGVYAVGKTEISAQWIRFVYTNASGSGVLSARFKSCGY